MGECTFEFLFSFFHFGGVFFRSFFNENRNGCPCTINSVQFCLFIQNYEIVYMSLKRRIYMYLRVVKVAPYSLYVTVYVHVSARCIGILFWTFIFWECEVLYRNHWNLYIWMYRKTGRNFIPCPKLFWISTLYNVNSQIHTNVVL